MGMGEWGVANGEWNETYGAGKSGKAKDSSRPQAGQRYVVIFVPDFDCFI
jgi:hypothetical protein